MLPFENANYFKIGISKDNINRILFNNSTFKLDLENVYIIEADLKIIKILEIELLYCFPKIEKNIDDNRNGITEVRDIKYLEEAIYILKNKPKQLNISIKKYNSEELEKKDRSFIFAFNLEQEKVQFLREYVILKRKSDPIHFHFNISKAIKKGIEILSSLNPDLKSRPDNIKIPTKRGTKGSLNGVIKLKTSFWITDSDRDFIYNYIYYKINLLHIEDYSKSDFISDIIKVLKQDKIFS